MNDTPSLKDRARKFIAQMGVDPSSTVYHSVGLMVSFAQQELAAVNERLRVAEAVIAFYGANSNWKSGRGGTRRILNIKVNETGSDKAREYIRKYPKEHNDGRSDEDK